MTFGLEKLEEDAALEYRKIIRQAHTYWEARFSSPIEHLFFTALRLARDITFRQRARCPFSELLVLHHPGDAELARHDHLGVVMQHKILDWAVDFSLLVRGKLVIAVECDGHEFHERTKEQAARDRSRDRRLQEAGLTIFRFTGSELYRNPLESALQVIGRATKLFSVIEEDSKAIKALALVQEGRQRRVMQGIPGPKRNQHLRRTAVPNG